MAKGQARLGPSQARAAAEGPSPFREAGGFIDHPLVRPGSLAARSYQMEIARRALGAPTLVVMPTGLGKTAIAGLVAAERLRTAGGFVLVLAPTRPLARQHASAFESVLAGSAASRTRVVTGSTRRADRDAAWAEGWVVVSTPETVEKELEEGALRLSRCSLLVVDEAHRAVGGYAYVQVARALRRDRPGGLTLALTASPGADRRRVAAVVDALGIRQVEVRTRDDADVAPYLRPVEVEVIGVDLTPEMVQVQTILERELQPRADELTRLGVLAPIPVRLLSRRELVSAGDQLRRRQAHDRGAFFAGLQTHAQAMLLAHALELLETQGCGPLADFLGRLGEEPDASRSERALARSAAVRDAALMARALAAQSHPKVERLTAVLRALLRDRPGAKAIVFAQYRDTVRGLVDRLGQPAPVGLGVACAAFTGKRPVAGGPEGMSDGAQARLLAEFAAGRVRVLVATSVAEEGLDLPEVDLVVFFEAVASEIRAVQRRGRTGRTAPGRVVVLVARDTRDEGALRAAERRERQAPRALGAVAARRAANRTLPIDGAALGGGKVP